MTATEAFGAGSNLERLAQQFSAIEVLHLSGRRWIMRRADGQELRAITDEGIGSVEGEEGFEEAWQQAER